MKKKILYGVLTFVCSFMVFLTVTEAAGPKTQTVPSTAMELGADYGSEAYAIIDDAAFDEYAQKVSFSGANGGKISLLDNANTPIIPFQKIVVSDSPNWSVASSLDVTKSATELAGAKGSWFTGYCLDGQKQEPKMSLFNFTPMAKVGLVLQASYPVAYFAGLTDEQKAALGITAETTSVPAYDRQFGVVATMALLNNKDLNKKMAAAEGYQAVEIVYNVLPEEGQPMGADATLSTLELMMSSGVPSSWATPTQFFGGAAKEMAKIKGAQQATVLIKSITFSNKLGDTSAQPITVSADKIGPVDANGYYNFTFSARDFLFDKFTAYNAADYKNSFAYGHSLWIIEHSYPSMGLEEFLTAVGSSKDALKAQLVGLYPSETFTDAEAENLMDNFVYHTVQMSIWKANNTFAGGELGNELYLGDLGTDNILNKIYQYLNADAEAHKNYGENVYDSKTVKIDETNKDKVVEKDGAYLYGPFKATYNVINPSNITYEIKSNNAKAVSITDKDGKAITALKSGDEFYIRCTKEGKVTSVDVTFSATGRTYDDNNKGTIYAANFVNNQNVITGLGYDDVSATGVLNLTFNPKTGVPNIAIVFVITLIAFSLGYLALSYNNKPVELE